MSRESIITVKLTKLENLYTYEMFIFLHSFIYNIICNIGSVYFLLLHNLILNRFPRTKPYLLPPIKYSLNAKAEIEKLMMIFS